jgi:hypothetical protein
MVMMGCWNNGFERLRKSIYCRGLIYQAWSKQFTCGFDESNPYHLLRIRDKEDRKKNRRIVYRCKFKNENSYTMNLVLKRATYNRFYKSSSCALGPRPQAA